MKLFLTLPFLITILAKGGAPKCTSCPNCMTCDPLIGCIYDNFLPCTNNNLKGFCLNGLCNITIGNIQLTKPPVCKTYSFSRISINGTIKIATTVVNNINGLSCTKPGAILESVCIKGTCTPYTLGIDLFGNPTGCQGLPNGFMCDTNSVFTDGEYCFNQKCVMPENSQSLCIL